MNYLKWITRLLFLALFVLLMSQGKMTLWLVLFGASLVAAVFFGRIYCGYVCPMNTVMLPVDWLARKLKRKPLKTPSWLSSGKVSWLALLGSLALMVLARRVLQANIPILIIWLVIAAIMTLFYQPAVFHNLLCPFAPLQKWFGQRALFSERVEQSKCIGCKRCEGVCPSQAILVEPLQRKAAVDTGLCFQCRNCVEACPVEAIRYARGKKPA